jgi:ribosomal protein S28E/S33
MTWQLWLLVVYAAFLLGFFLNCILTVAKEADVNQGAHVNQEAEAPPGLKFGDVLMLMGSEGENLPRLDIRREVAEQLGCEDDLLIKPKRRERAGRGTPPPVKFGDMLILMGSEGDNLPRSRPGPGKEAEHE